MRKAIKYSDSSILLDDLKYISNNTNNNKKIRDELFVEQKYFCAYTDEYISRTDAGDIEHFDPTVKDTNLDNYNNWFIVKHQWNKEKSNKWQNFLPALHPTSADFEDRIIYQSGDYVANDTDIEAKNLISLLNLDDPILANKRKRYIKRKKEEILVYGQSVKAFFETLITDDICQVSYLRAITEEFGIDIWDMLP